MAKLGPIDGKRKEPRQLGQLADRSKNVDWTLWWRDWKAADKEIEEDFKASTAKPFPGVRYKQRKRKR